MRTLYYAPHRMHRSTRQMDGVYIPLNISANEDTFVISAFVPGIKAEDLQIEVLEDTIEIEGEFGSIQEEGMRMLRQEQPTGTFHRSLHLRTRLDASKAEAEVRDGILTLRVPMAEEAKTRKITVKAK